MKRVKTLFITVTVIFSMLLPCLSVSADIISEPRDDDFYMTHNCTADYNWTFFRVAEDGTPVYKNPEKKGDKNLDQDKYVSCNVHYTDKEGIQWWFINYVYILDDENDQTSSHKRGEEYGWIKEADLLKLYDADDFYAEYNGQFVSIDPKKRDQISEKSDGNLTWYMCPGGRKALESRIDSEWELPTFTYCYEDEEGRQWGYVPYYYGVVNFWLCIDEPNGVFEPDPERMFSKGASVDVPESTEAEKEEKKEETEATETAEATTEKGSEGQTTVPLKKSRSTLNYRLIGLIGGGVVVLAVITIVALALMKKKK